jgi:hypothetical protein
MTSIPSAQHPAFLAGGELRRAADAVETLGAECSDYRLLTDEQVVAGLAVIAAAERIVQNRKVWLAAVLADRSRFELGYQGLAARKGYLSAEEMFQHVTGSSRNDAYTILGLGRMLADTESAQRELESALYAPDPDPDPDLAPIAELDPDAPAPAPASDVFDDLPGSDGADGADGTGEPGEGDAGVFAALLPWQAPIARELAAGRLSAEKADSIRKGLGDIDAAVTKEKLAVAVAGLLGEAAGMNADQLLRRARRMRDELDTAGIAAREKRANDDRSLKTYRLADGKVRLSALFGPEDGEFVLSTFDCLTSPRRGGVRFVDKRRAAWAETIRQDPRTTEQLAADSFIAFLKLGVDADPHTVIGGRRPAVRMIITRPAPAPAPGPTLAPAPGAARDSTSVSVSTVAVAVAVASDAAAAGPAPASAAAAVPAPASAAASDAAAAGPAPASAAASAAAPGVDEDPARTAHSGGFGRQTPCGVIEGTPLTVSAATIARNICDTGMLGIIVDEHGQVVDVSDEKRWFSPAQRSAIGHRDNGCRWPDCALPPSWCEVHVLEGAAGAGESRKPADIGDQDEDHDEVHDEVHDEAHDEDQGAGHDGCLLCGPHHQRLHAEGWRIARAGGKFRLTPPPPTDSG